MEYLACAFSRMKFDNMFSMFFNVEFPFKLTVFMFMYVNVDFKLQRQYSETWVSGMFSCCAHQVKSSLGLGNHLACTHNYVYMYT